MGGAAPSTAGHAGPAPDCRKKSDPGARGNTIRNHVFLQAPDMRTHPWHKRFRRHLRAKLFMAGMHGLGKLPIARAKRLGGGLGGVAHALARRDRRIAAESLTQAFPHLSVRERTALARRSFQGCGECIAELACLHQIDPVLDDYVRLAPEDEMVLRVAQAEGRGVIVITGHVGNFELLARRIARVAPVTTIARASSCKGVTDWIGRMRAGGGVRTLWRGQPDVARGMLGTLRSGGILGILIDQDTAVQGVFVDFFGRAAHTPRAAADLALRLKVPVVACFVFRRPEGGWEMSAERIVPEPAWQGDAGVVAYTQRMSDAIQRAIETAPDSWVWMHRRWKTRPGEDAIGSSFGGLVSEDPPPAAAPRTEGPVSSASHAAHAR